MPPQARLEEAWLVAPAKSPRSINATFAPRAESAAAETAPLMPPPRTSTSNSARASRSRLVWRSVGGRSLMAATIALRSSLAEPLLQLFVGDEPEIDQRPAERAQAAAVRFGHLLQPLETSEQRGELRVVGRFLQALDARAQVGHLARLVRFGLDLGDLCALGSLLDDFADLGDLGRFRRLAAFAGLDDFGSFRCRAPLGGLVGLLVEIGAPDGQLDRGSRGHRRVDAIAGLVRQRGQLLRVVRIR